MRFNVITLVGLILIVLGALAFAVGGLGDGEVLDAGAAETPVESGREGALPFTPLVGGLAVVGGIVLVVVGQRGPPGGARSRR